MSHEIHADYASGNALYAVIRSLSGQVWHPAGQVFESWGDAGHTAADYAIVLTDCSGSRYVGDFDAAVPPGSYVLQVFRQSGAAPADSDPLAGANDNSPLRWTGSGELTATKLLANKAVMDKLAGTIDFYDDDGQTVLFTHVPVDTPATISRDPMYDG